MGAPAVVAGVAPQLQELADVVVPHLEVGAARTGPLAPLVDRDQLVVVHLEERDDALAPHTPVDGHGLGLILRHGDVDERDEVGRDLVGAQAPQPEDPVQRHVGESLSEEVSAALCLVEAGMLDPVRPWLVAEPGQQSADTVSAVYRGNHGSNARYDTSKHSGGMEKLKIVRDFMMKGR